MSQIWIYTDDVYFDLFQNDFSREEIFDFLDRKEKYVWLNYLLQSVGTICKITLLSIILNTGLLLYKIEVKNSYLLNSLILCEFIFFIPKIVTLIWFGFFEQSFSISDIDNFHVGSIFNIIGSEDIDSFLRYPLSFLNLFQLFYILLLTYCLSLLVNISYDQSFKIVLLTYGSALLIWLTSLMFIISTIQSE
ncbi:MAG: hypothetical protein ACK5YS_04920 [bacterium]